MTTNPYGPGAYQTASPEVETAAAIDIRAVAARQLTNHGARRRIVVAVVVAVIEHLAARREGSTLRSGMLVGKTASQYPRWRAPRAPKSRATCALPA